MKIGIMSMHRINNYGSFLQALGLKTEIERLGHEVCFVDFRVKSCLSQKKWKNLLPFRMAKRILKPQKMKELYPETRHMRKYDSILGLTDKWEYSTAVDTLVIGSDEVFNFCQTNACVGYAPELLGLHSKAKKVISYAASAGNLTVEKLKSYGKVKLASKLIKRISVISVRDKNTGVFVKELTGRESEYHLDPVLVSDFGNVFTDNVEEKDYIVVYGYPHRFSEAEGEQIKQFAARKGKKLLAIGGEQPFCDVCIECSPLEVFAYFKHADCVITDTFHGTIFSIINHKPFLTVVRSDSAVGYGNEGKLADLLERLHLTARSTQLTGDIDSAMDSPIEYEAIDKLRLEERERTRAYLKANL